MARSSTGPLLAWHSGLASDKDFVATVRRALSRQGVTNVGAYMGHSFRSGAATSAAAAGAPDWLIQPSSTAYQTYIRTPKCALTNVCRAILNASL